MGTKTLGVLLHRLISGCRGRIGWGSCSLDRRGAAFCLVGEAVVAAAEKGEVVEVGFAAVCPVVAVVGVAPAWRPVTAFPAAASVADDQSPALGCGDGAGTPPDLEDFCRPCGDDTRDPGVTEEAEGVFSGEHRAVVVFGAAVAAGELVEVDDHRHMRIFPADHWGVVMVQEVTTDVGQRIGTALL